MSAARAKPRNESFQATELLIRRILCPQTHGNLSDSQVPLERLLPPLSSSNAVDLQLYAVTAVVMRDFVYSWYGKITPDQTFVEETIRIVAHCTRELEQRVRRLDLELLLLHEIPNIIKLHIDAFRIAYGKGGAAPDSNDPEILYHALFPHAALSPAPEHGLSTVEQIQNEAAYRQLLVQGVLAVLLPTEDLQNPCLRILVTDIIADMILGNGIGAKASAGWLVWEGIAKVLEQQQQQQLYQNGRKGERKSNIVTQQLTGFSSGADGKPVSTMFWHILQYIYLLILGTRFLLIGLWTAASSNKQEDDEWIPVPDKDRPSPIGSKVEALSFKRPFLTYSVFELLSLLLELQRRMPWLTGCMSLIRHHLMDGIMKVGSTGAVLDKFLRQTFQQQILRPELLPLALQSVRNAIFPNNAIGPARTVPLAHEQRLIKRRAAIAVLNTIPSSLSSHFLFPARDTFDRDGSGNTPRTPFASSATTVTGSAATDPPANTLLTTGTTPISATDDQKSLEEDETRADDDKDRRRIMIPDADPQREAQLVDIESVLSLFGNQYMNKHMLYSLIELIIVRLVPEIQTKSVRELLEEREIRC